MGITHATVAGGVDSSDGKISRNAWNDEHDTPAAAVGDLLVAQSGGTLAALSVGPDGYVLTADSAEATGMKWVAGGTDLSSVIGLGSGATFVGTGTDIGASPLQITPPAGIASGDLVVLAVQTVNSVPNASGPTGGAAWTEMVRFDTSSSEFVAVYWKVAGASETTWELTHSVGTEAAVAAVTFRGVDALWSLAWGVDSADFPAVIGHPEGLEVLIFAKLQGNDIDLAAMGGAITEDAYVNAAGTNSPQVAIAHRDTIASFDAPRLQVIGQAATTFTTPIAAVFYNAS